MRATGGTSGLAPVLLVGLGGDGNAVDSFNINAFYFEGSRIPVFRILLPSTSRQNLKCSCPPLPSPSRRVLFLDVPAVVHGAVEAPAAHPQYLRDFGVLRRVRDVIHRWQGSQCEQLPQE